MFDSKILKLAGLCFLGAGFLLLLSFILLLFDSGGYLLLASGALFAVTLVISMTALLEAIIGRDSRRGFLPALVLMVLSGMPPALFCSIYISAQHRKAMSMEHTLSELADVLKNYTEKHNGCLPQSEAWCDTLMAFDSRLAREHFQHPRAKAFNLSGECHIAFNSQVSGMAMAVIPSDTVLLFEANGPWNLQGDQLLLMQGYQKDGYAYVLLANYEIVKYRYDKDTFETDTNKRLEFKKLRWYP